MVKKNKIYLTHKGETLSIREWSDKLNINFETLQRRTRLYPGNIEKILNPNLKVGRDKGCHAWNQKYPPNTRKEYAAWYDMHFRCKDKDNKNYGGRKINVCQRWEKFENFLLDMKKCPKGMSLDRKDNNKDYSKNNCRWATKLEQENNKRNNVRITFKNKIKTIAEWSRILGTRWQNIAHRHKVGLPLDHAGGRWGKRNEED